MALTVKEIADSLNINRSKVYRAIERLSLEPLMVDGVAKYGEDAIEAIKTEIERVDSKKRSSHGAGESPRSGTGTPSGDQSELIEALKFTIKSQADTIEHLRTENNELRSMIKREQDIRAGQIMLEVNTKPKLTERIKSLFSSHDKEKPISVQDEPFSGE
mgnify:FL=1